MASQTDSQEIAHGLLDILEELSTWEPENLRELENDIARLGKRLEADLAGYEFLSQGWQVARIKLACYANLAAALSVIADVKEGKT